MAKLSWPHANIHKYWGRRDKYTTGLNHILHVSPLENLKSFAGFENFLCRSPAGFFGTCACEIFSCRKPANEICNKIENSFVVVIASNLLSYNNIYSITVCRYLQSIYSPLFLCADLICNDHLCTGFGLILRVSCVQCL